MPDPTNRRTIALYLEEIDDLFVAPDLNPLSRRHLMRAGIDELVHNLVTTRESEQIAIALTLPPEQITPDLEQRLKKAIDQYCMFRMRELGEEIAAIRQSARRKWRVGLMIMAIALVISGLGYAIGAAARSSIAFVGAMIGEIFIIAAWVVIWNPIETQLYEWRPQQAEMDALQSIREAPIALTARDNTAATPTTPTTSPTTD